MIRSILFRNKMIISSIIKDKNDHLLIDTRDNREKLKKYLDIGTMV